MSTSTDSVADWTLPADARAVGQLRRSAAAFAAALGASDDLTRDIALAVSEAVTNVVLHAYAGRERGVVRMRCRAEGAGIVVEVEDEGVGVAPRDDSPGVGHGLATVGALARKLEVTARAHGPGTVVAMLFSAAPVTAAGASGLEPLCALALERLADVSCVDVINGGVLRRASAEVAGDPAMTQWLRDATPPAKPGTATWDALREGGARLVVHDPTVPRSPGGVGERLDLAWWVSVPLEDPNGVPAALWGIGGRAGGRPVPSPEVIGMLADAARTGLTHEMQRDVLRMRLELEPSP